MAQTKRSMHNVVDVYSKLRSRVADKSQLAQLKVRLPEALRWSLEREASSREHSMNTEIVRRLRESFLAQDKTTTLIAKTLLSGLDDAVIEKMVDIVMRERAKDEMADMAREDALLDRDDAEGSG